MSRETLANAGGGYDLNVLNGLNDLNYFMLGSAISGLRLNGDLMQIPKSKILNLAIALFVMLLSWPHFAEAQAKTKVYRVGYMSPRNESGRNEDAFRKRMRELGYVEGQNAVIDWRFASGKASLFPDLAAELVQLNVDVIVGQGVGATGAAKRATNTIPIVMSNADDDPVRLGLVASLARPGGNVTGFISISSDIAGKRLELLKETVPKASRIAILSRPRSQGTAAASHVRETEVAARALGIKLETLEARGREDLETAFRSARKVADALIVVLVAGMIMTEIGSWISQSRHGYR